MVAAALLALVAAIVLAVVLSGGGEEEPSTQAGGTTATQAAKEREEAAAPKRVDSSPESVVRAFYERAAEGDYDGAWNLAGPRFRAAFGSRAGLEDTLGSLRGIQFVTLRETGREGRTATLQVQTVAEHTNRTDRCTGTLQAVRRGNEWRVEPGNLSCQS